MKFKSILLVLTGLLISASVMADKPAYRIFNAKGKKASYKELLKDAGDMHVVFFWRVTRQSYLSLDGV